MIFIITILLISADAVFRDLADSILSAISFGNIFGVSFTIVVVFFAVYCVFTYFTKGKIKNEVTDTRVLEPVMRERDFSSCWQFVLLIYFWWYFARPFLKTAKC